jgi:DNA-directed RNA polymerase specialized sigma24 family protein
MRKGTAVSVLTDEDLLSAALHNKPRSWEELTSRFDAYLYTIFRRRAGDLPEDIHGELVQEVWMAVALQRPPAFDPATQTAKDFIGQFISVALNVIRSDYCPPGQRTRDRTSFAPTSAVGDEDQENLMSLVEDPRWEADLSALEARIDVDAMAAVADEPTRSAITAIRLNDLTVKDAALLVGLARETLRRRLLALPALLQLWRRSAYQQRHLRFPSR